jgi:RecB family endonuclease NucS
MGYWGLGIFENDDAVDLISEFEEQNSFSVLVSAIELVITDDLVEVEVVNQAAAAIEIIAAIHESKSESFPELDSMTYEQLVSNFNNEVTNTVLSLCEDAISIITRMEDNMQVEILDNQGLLEEWLDVIDELSERLF